jgi:hypothetical protein
VSALPATNLPRAVRDQIAKANQIAEEIKKAQAGSPPADDEPVKSEPESKAAEGGDPTSPPATAPQKSEPAAPAPDGSAGAPADDYKQRYSVLQGKYNAEVPRLTAQVNDLMAVNADLRNRLAELEIKAAASSRAPAKTSLSPVTEEEIKAFGPDLYDFILRTAAQIAAKQAEDQTAELKSKIQKVEEAASTAATSVAQSARERLFAALTEEVPNWNDLNSDPKFLAWLDQVDPFSGQVRGQMLREAYGKNDAPRVIAFFTRFLQENAAVTASSDGRAAPKPKGEESQRDLSEFTAPGTPKTGPAGAPNEGGKRVWTRAELRALYAKRNEYTRRGKPIPDSLQKEERELSKALAEGRVVG